MSAFCSSDLLGVPTVQTVDSRHTATLVHRNTHVHTSTHLMSFPRSMRVLEPAWDPALSPETDYSCSFSHKHPTPRGPGSSGAKERPLTPSHPRSQGPPQQGNVEAATQPGSPLPWTRQGVSPALPKGGRVHGPSGVASREGGTVGRDGAASMAGLQHAGEMEQGFPTLG